MSDPLRSVRRSGGLMGTVVLSYVVATGLGVVMRFQLLGWHTGIPFDHLLHAHSHTLYFGWAGLGVLVLAADALPRHQGPLQQTILFLALSIPAIFVGFLALGYHPVTIGISTVVMVGWYVAIRLWWREAKAAEGTGFRILRVALAYLAASSLGVWVLAVLQATGFGRPLTETLAIHAFLLGFAWFLVLGVAGSLVIHAQRLGIHLDQHELQRALRWWAPLAIFTFPLGVSGGPEFGWLGAISRLAGVALLYPGWLWARALWRGTGRHWKPVAVWFAMTTVATSFVAVAGTPALDLVGRQGVVAYLHVLLVGFVSASLFNLLSERPPTRVLRFHHLMLGIMVVGLTLASAGLFKIGMWVAAGGGLGLWVVGVIWANGIRRRGRNGPDHLPAA